MADLDFTQKRNALRIIAALTCTKLGDVLINPKTMLTWLLTQMGVGGALISLLVPIRESGSMLPQLFVSGWIKRSALRKRVFVAGSLVEAVAVAVMGASALWLPPEVAGVVVVFGVAVLATARSFCSISGRDVMGKTIPRGFRGRVGGASATVSGIIATVAALALIVMKEEAGVRVIAGVVMTASLLWFIAGWIFSRVEEPEGAAQADTSGIRGRFSLVRDDARFRKFIVARVLLLGSALASPLMVVLAGQSGGSMLTLGAFVIAAGVATTSSSFLWGRLSDRASHLAMALGGFTAACVGGLAWWLGWSSPQWAAHPLVWPLLFLLFNVGYAGVRLGRTTWVVDAAEGDDRTDYVSAANTLIAVAILILGALAAPLQMISPLIPLAGYSVLCLLGCLAALRLGLGDG